MFRRISGYSGFAADQFVGCISRLVPQRLYCFLVGPGGFEPPTSTMSRLTELATTRWDTVENTTCVAAFENFKEELKLTI